MRGQDQQSGSLFSYVDLEARVPGKHPLRLIRSLVNDVLEDLSADFEAMYSGMGRPGIPPEKLLRALLLQAFYSIRSERQLMEQLEFNMLFRWFVGLSMDDPVWHASTYAKNRDRLLEADVSRKLLTGVIGHRRVRPLLSRDHFSVDGTLIDAWASMKSFRPIDEGDEGDTGNDDRGAGGSNSKAGRNREHDFRGRKRSNATHRSRTDGDARLYRKGSGKESRLCFIGHACMENRNGLAVAGELTLATGTAEREAARRMIEAQRMSGNRADRRITVGGDKGYDAGNFVQDLRAARITPHIARNDYPTKTGKRRKTSVDGRTTRHPGYGISQRIRKRIEEIFGWMKESAGLRQTKFRGRDRVNGQFILNLAAYNLIRLPKLLETEIQGAGP